MGTLLTPRTFLFSAGASEQMASGEDEGLDYTGKAMFRLNCKLEGKNPQLQRNVLFIHTGGQFGNFAQIDEIMSTFSDQ